MPTPDISMLPMSEKLYVEIHAAFRPLVITPDTTREDIMYASGQQAVLRWLNTKLKRQYPDVPKNLTLVERFKLAIKVLRGTDD